MVEQVEPADVLING